MLEVFSKAEWTSNITFGSLSLAIKNHISSLYLLTIAWLLQLSNVAAYAFFLDCTQEYFLLLVLLMFS